MSEPRPGGITRRQLLRRAGAAGAAAALGSAGLPAAARPAAEAVGAAQAPAESSRSGETYEHFTAEEAELLEAIADHLIPADEHGPGAVEARAVSSSCSSRIGRQIVSSNFRRRTDRRSAASD